MGGGRLSYKSLPNSLVVRTSDSEEKGRWPRDMVAGIVALIPKAREEEGPTSRRPITILGA
eukprot:1477571-Amphidinium_carterae.1